MLGRPSYDSADLQQIELGQNDKGKEVLLIRRKGGSKPESIRCDDHLRQVLPKLSAAANAAGVTVVGF
jgi:NAD(P)H-dependent FMN reductase